jgi:protein-arginine kinase activator protein McsA
MYCSNCYTNAARFVRTRIDGADVIESCDRCMGVRPSYARDASGNRVSVGNEILGKYSYAIDGPITSQRQLSEHLKRNGLIQRGY